ncbi:MAG: ribonuclease III [Lachnospiraceae bacterium]|uniref:ribonuclease III n=1 Tax=Falcatimonas sp. MSJ-15 TaxID=2841515 RepID=UPI001C106C62|nr:ribonuclease III [Falcatimonas sp. MSJ-15]MBQ5734358.1 ribonuclease III [Lachnospiraceae bacterium]MBU5471508.1 ribonuclease III [Falcatimonas sp. MSJ-15]
MEEKILTNNKRIEEFEKIIGYSFRNKSLISEALTHSSYANEHRLNYMSNNERLEFLGDAVLEISISEYLYNRYPDEPEGYLTKMRASIVCEPTLALCSKDIRLGEFLLLGKGEELTGGRERKSITSDAFEAVIGAIYLDGGFANAKEFIDKFILADIKDKQLFYDSKTILQEIVQAKGDKNLVYKLVGENGPDHNKQFEVNAMLGDEIVGKGIGRTKKAAEQEAAYNAIMTINKKDK